MPQTTRATRDGVRLPFSSPTRDGRYKSFAKLLCRVDPDPSSGFSFHGRIAKPGAMVEYAWLWPTSEYPADPLLLEYVANVGRGHEAQLTGMLYVLWRFDAHTREWSELARAAGFATEWIIILGPIAAHTLRPARKPAAREEMAAIAGRIAAAVDLELTGLEGGERYQVLDVVHNQLAIRMCQAS